MSIPDIQLAPTTAPRFPVRIAWWFGIYLVGCAIFVSYERVRVSSPHGWEDFGLGVAAFPMYLAGLLLPSFRAALMDSSWLPFFGYGIYVLHLIATLRVSRRITFFIMLALFGVLIGFTFWGGDILFASLD